MASKIPILSPPPPARLALGFGRVGLVVLLDEQLAAGRFQHHLEFIVAQETVTRIFGENFYQRIARWLRHFRQHKIRWHERYVDVRRDELLHRGRIEGRMSRECLIQRATEAVHVREKRFLLAFDFFRGDVIRRAVRYGTRFLLGIHAAREAEVHELRLVVAVEKDVSRFDVAVQEIVFEREIECGGDLDSDVENVQFRHASLLLDAPIQTTVIGQFHDEVSLTFVLIERIDVDDVRVVHPGAGAGLAIEGIHLRRVFHLLLLHELHRHQSFEHGVKRAIHDAVAAGRDDAAQFELPEHHRHHDGMPAFAARHGAERGKIARNENLRLAPPAGDHP
jgi:hypothetical protein